MSEISSQNARPHSEVSSATRSPNISGESLPIVPSVGGASGEITNPQVAEISDEYKARTDAPHQVADTLTEAPALHTPAVRAVNRICFVQQSDDRHGVRPSEPTSPVNIPYRFRRMQRKIVEKFSSDTKGLDIDRVHAFLGRTGLDQPPVVTVWRSQRPQAEDTRAAGTRSLQQEILEELEEMDGVKYTQLRNVGGLYVAEIDTSFVFRTKSLEGLNGPEFSESTHVHESFHASSRHRVMQADVIDGQVRASIMRVGQRAGVLAGGGAGGTFIEEGAAEHLRGIYIANELGRPRGFADMPTEITMVTSPADSSELPIPSRYFSHTKLQDKTNSPQSYAGAGMDLLIEKDPGLWPALIEARRSVEGLREVVGRINAINDGLYRRLRNNFNGQHGLAAGLRHVIDVLNV